MGLSDYDFDSIFTAIVICLFVIGVFIAFFFILHDHNIEEYRAECASNPRLRYAQECSNNDDCITKCMERLYDEKK